MVVIDQRHAFTCQIGGKGFELGPESHHFHSRQTRPVVHRLARIAVNGVGGFADDHHLAAIVLQLGQMVLAGLDLILDRPHQKLGRIPARDEFQTIFGQKRAQRLRLIWPAVAVLNPVKADLTARLVQNAGGRDIGADGLVVVIGPSDGVGSELNHLMVPS